MIDRSLEHACVRAHVRFVIKANFVRIGASKAIGLTHKPGKTNRFSNFLRSFSTEFLIVGPFRTLSNRFFQLNGRKSLSDLST